jgi:hypothetical protein
VAYEISIDGFLAPHECACGPLRYGFRTLVAWLSRSRAGRCLDVEQQTVKENTMALRVPKAELTTELSENMIKQLGAVPEPVEVIADGGGLVAAAPAPVHGAELVAKMLARPNRAVSTVWLNGAPAGRIEIDGQLAAVSLVVENGRVTRIHAMANPRKLTRLEEPAELAR